MAPSSCLAQLAHVTLGLRSILWNDEKVMGKRLREVTGIRGGMPFLISKIPLSWDLSTALSVQSQWSASTVTKKTPPPPSLHLSYVSPALPVLLIRQHNLQGFPSPLD